MSDLILWRRHLKTCPQARKGREATKCKCPIHCDGYLNGERVKKSMGTRDWTRAEWRLAQMLLPESNTNPAKRKPIPEAVASFLEDCVTRRLAPSSLVSYRNTLSAFVKFCDASKCFDMSQLSIDTITSFRAKRPGRTQRKHADACHAMGNRADRRDCNCPTVTARPSAATLRKELELLRGFCGFCKVRKWIDENPASGIKQPAEDEPSTLPFEQDEVQMILENCGHGTFKRDRDRLRARGLVLLLLYSGFRISDAAKFRRRNLNIETGRFLIRTKKTGENVMFTLQPPALEALLAMPVENEEYFFWSGEDGSDLDTCVKSLRRTLDAIRRKVNINVHPHRFRDTFAVRLLEHGAAIRTVQRLLGHKSVTTTEKYYAKWVKSHQKLLDEAAATLDFVSPATGLDDPPQDTFRDAERNVIALRAKTPA